MFFNTITNELNNYTLFNIYEEFDFVYIAMNYVKDYDISVICMDKFKKFVFEKLGVNEIQFGMMNDE